MEQNKISEIEEDEIEYTGKSELLKLIACKVKCVRLELFKYDWEITTRNTLKNILETVELKVGYNQEEYDTFLNKIDIPFQDVCSFNKRLSGNVWMEDGSWYTIEYDQEYSSLYFVLHKFPQIPTELLNQ